MSDDIKIQPIGPRQFNSLASKNTAAKKAEVPADEVDISNNIPQLAKNIINDLTEISISERVERIKQAVKDSTYQIDRESIANKLIDEYMTQQTPNGIKDDT
jgi:flagellar biosynthesis anti-sigma factor FlgM